MQARRLRRLRSGFTLIEVLLVMMILVTLAALVTVKIVKYGPESKKKAAVVQIDSFKTALDLYKSQNDDYPTTQQGLNALVSNPNPAGLPNWVQGLDKIPLDPWGHPYQYHCPGSNGKDYDIESYGPTGQAGAADAITN